MMMMMRSSLCIFVREASKLLRRLGSRRPDGPADWRDAGRDARERPGPRHDCRVHVGPWRAGGRTRPLVVNAHRLQRCLLLGSHTEGAVFAGSRHSMSESQLFAPLRLPTVSASEPLRAGTPSRSPPSSPGPTPTPSRRSSAARCPPAAAATASPPRSTSLRPCWTHSAHRRSPAPP